MSADITLPRISGLLYFYNYISLEEQQTVTQKTRQNHVDLASFFSYH